jgi:hypothetical protein
VEGCGGGCAEGWEQRALASKMEVSIGGMCISLHMHRNILVLEFH